MAGPNVDLRIGPGAARIGHRCRLRNMDRFETGEEVWLPLARCFGWIVERFDDDHWVVELEGDDIPVHDDDVLPASQAPTDADEPEPESKEPKAKDKVDASSKPVPRHFPADYQGEKPKPQPSAPKQPHQSNQPQPLAEPGLHLLLIPTTTATGSDLMGRRLLVNNTAHAFAISVEGLPGGAKTGDLAAGERLSLGTWDAATLHDRPLTIATWRRIANGGTDHAFRKELRIKAAVFAKRLDAWRSIRARDADTGVRPSAEGLVWTLFADLPPKSPSKLAIPLPDNLAMRNAIREDRRRKGSTAADSANPWDLYQGASRDSLANVNFPTDIDLHAEKLLSNPKQYAPAELLGIQLSRAAHYLDKAAALHIPRVYLIHGVGSGRLRTELDALLKRHPHVTAHHHGFFPKYGFGATEVRLE